MPVLGTTVQWQIAGFPAATSWGAMMRSVHRASPAIDLTALGMPGCFAHLTDPVTTLVVSPGTTAQVPEVLPNNTALLGVTVVGQAASYNPSLSPLGVVLSNAIVLELGF